MANPELIVDPIVAAVGGGAGLTAVLYFIRMIRRLAGAEARDTIADSVSNSLYTNLAAENKRMSEQMANMSVQLQKLSNENHELSLKITKLTVQIESMAEVHSTNVDLQDRLALKDELLMKLGAEIDRLNNVILGGPHGY